MGAPTTAPTGADDDPGARSPAGADPTRRPSDVGRTGSDGLRETARTERQVVSSGEASAAIAESSPIAPDVELLDTRRRRVVRRRTDEERERRRLLRRLDMGAGVIVAFTNLGGAAAVFVLAAWVLPSDPVDDAGHVLILNLLLTVAWLPLAVGAGTFWGRRALRPVRRWLNEGRAPTVEEEIAVLRSPMRLFRIQVRLWVASAIVFAIVNGVIAPRLISRVGLPIALGGLTTASVAYLTTERMLRPLAARALYEGSLAKPNLPGVTARHMLTWALGTAVPVLGLVIAGIVGVADTDTTRLSLAVTMVALGGTALAIGLWTSFLGARAIADPIRSVRIGLDRVAEGDLAVQIPVYDGSEVGLLQAGFNKMVEGLRERERIRDLFGRHVGQEVASEALDQERGLGGELREVAVLFVDMVGSTRLAAEVPPSQVVEVLNCYFAVVVDVVAEHGGWINKFQGDAALAIFGAPADLDDASGRALAAAREMRARLLEDLPDVDVGIGVAAGPAVAGNVGSEDRFEYTVIGDPVNEAARLTELAKDVPGRVLASGPTVAAASSVAAAEWVAIDSVVLRGRTEPTTLHTPIE